MRAWVIKHKQGYVSMDGEDYTPDIDKAELYFNREDAEAETENGNSGEKVVQIRLTATEDGRVRK